MKKILVVDDTKNIRNLLTTCLKIEGYEVINAKDGFQAIELFKQEPFDLAFIDIKMPNCSGTEVLKSIRDMGINIPVIIITAFATVKNAVECTRMGAVAYLQKPFTAEKVRIVMNELQQQKCIDETQKLLSEAERLIEENNFERAIDLLKKDLPNQRFFFLLSKAHAGLGLIEEAELYNKLYKIL